MSSESVKCWMAFAGEASKASEIPIVPSGGAAIDANAAPVSTCEVRRRGREKPHAVDRGRAVVTAVDPVGHAPGGRAS